MANNPYKNKVVYNGNTLIDITDTTATVDKVMEGYTFYGASGQKLTGTASGGGVVISDTTDSHGGTIRTITSTNVINVGTKTITQNGTYDPEDDNLTAYSEVTVNVPSGTPTLQSKSATPTESAQTITADSGYDGLSSVEVGAISSSYVGSNITRRSSTDLSASGATVSVPSGYYENNASKAVSSGSEGTPTATKGTVSNHSISVTPSVTNTGGYISGGTHTGTAVSVSASELVSGNKAITTAGSNIDVANYATASVSSGSATAPASITGTSATVSTGTNTLTLSKTVSVTPTVSAGYVSSGTAGNSSVSLTASVATKGATTYNTSSSDQTIASGTYLTGTQTIRGVTTSNLTADNIKSGVTVTVGDSADADRVLSVTGTYSGGGSGKAFYAYIGMASRRANSYGSTSASVSVTKAGTYTISYVAVRGSSSGTMGTNLHIGSTTGTDNTTWSSGTYGQHVILTGQSISANTTVTVYATSGSNSRYIYVGNLIVEEE